MTRWKAASIHLGASALVILTILLLVLWRWYPPALIPMSGIAGLLLLIAVVDVVLGPFLTLVVYKKGKRSLPFDLAVIVCLQIGMLGYGLHILSLNRPVFMVAASDRLELVRASEVDEPDLQHAQPPFNKLSWNGPVWAGVSLPTDQALRAAVFDQSLAGRDIYLQPVYFVEFERSRPSLAASARSLADLLPRLSSAELRRLEAKAEDGDLEVYRYLPVNSSRGAAMVLVSDDGELSAPAAVDPYEVLRRTVD